MIMKKMMIKYSRNKFKANFLKRVKRYALENGTTITNVTVKAFEEFLSKHSKGFS
ncbi:MAG: hypothetical protein ACR2F1_05585 [Nitrososphaeraceae archaeon]